MSSLRINELVIPGESHLVEGKISVGYNQYDFYGDENLITHKIDLKSDYELSSKQLNLLQTKCEDLALEIQEKQIDELLNALPIEIDDESFDVHTHSSFGEEVSVNGQFETKFSQATEIQSLIQSEHDNFDLDEYVNLWGSMRGERGVPATYIDLLAAGEEHKSIINDWNQEAKEVMQKEPYVYKEKRKSFAEQMKFAKEVYQSQDIKQQRVPQIDREL